MAVCHRNLSTGGPGPRALFEDALCVGRHGHLHSPLIQNNPRARAAASVSLPSPVIPQKYLLLLTSATTGSLLIFSQSLRST